MSILGDIVSFFTSLFGSLLTFIVTIKDSIIYGLKFVLDFFMLIPNFLMSTFFPNLPEFFSTTLYGLMGFMLFIVAAKIFMFLKG
jgi:hypothetical protein